MSADDEGSVQSLQSEASFVNVITADSSLNSCISQISSYIIFYCDFETRRLSAQALRNLFQDPILINPNNHYERYSRDLMVSFEYMLNESRIRPTYWLRKVINYEQYEKKFELNFEEFAGEMSYLSGKIGVPDWDRNDLQLLYAYIVEKSGSDTINNHNLVLAFKKFKLSTRKVSLLNASASVLMQLNMFMFKHRMSLNDFLPIGKATLTFHELNSTITQLLSTHNVIITQKGQRTIGSSYDLGGGDSASTLSNITGDSSETRRRLVNPPTLKSFKSGLADRPHLSNNLSRSQNYSTSFKLPPVLSPNNRKPWREYDEARGKVFSDSASVSDDASSAASLSNSKLAGFRAVRERIKKNKINSDRIIKNAEESLQRQFESIIKMYDNRLVVAKRVVRASYVT